MRSFRGARVAGMGVISAAGLGVTPLLDACRDRKSLVSHDPKHGVPTARIANEILAQTGYRELSRPEAMTRYALDAALASSGFGSIDAETGLIFATTTGHLESWEVDLPPYLAGEITTEAYAKTFRDHYLGRSLAAVPVQGPMQIFTSACAASTQALALACSWLRRGKVSRCIVGATETLTTTTVKGFGCFNLLSPHIATPFDQERTGINLGEASVFFCLDARTDHDAPAWILGGASALDAFDMTAPHPEGRGLYQAMQSALTASKLTTRQIDWVAAHGTGTIANDAAEAAALSMLFGPDGPPVSSTKAVHGHTLAASGILEAALAISAMANQEILPTTNLTTPDSRLKLRFVNSVQPSSPETVLKTTLGFGGVNAAVVLSRRPSTWTL